MSTVAYRETFGMQRPTLLKLTSILCVGSLPLAAGAVRAGAPWLAAAAGGAVAVLTAVFGLSRYQLEVRDDGLYYRVVPFRPRWRQLAERSSIDGVEPRPDVNGAELMGRGRLFRADDGTRLFVGDFEGGVRIERDGESDVFVSSTRPGALTAALRRLDRPASL